MINYVGFIISFILGYLLCKHKERLFHLIKVIFYSLKYQVALKESKYHNDFLESDMSDYDYEDLGGRIK